jgi:AcrR family transcriptional regulator
MPRVKILPDADVLEIAHRLIHRHGPDALTFAMLSEASGLSAATLVQRFGSKAELIRAALLQAWDRLDDRTAALAASTPKTPEGAVAMLVALSGGYGDIDAYAQGLLVLREDFRDPALRARGAAWKTALMAALDECFAGLPGKPPGVGLLMAAQWQGLLIWWGFDPVEDVAQAVKHGLQRFVMALLAK